MKLQDTITASGHLTLSIYQKKGLLGTIKGKNLIVNSGREAIAEILGGTPNKQITQFGAGTNSAAPVLGDTALTGAFTKSLATVTYPVAGQVVFTFEIDYSEGNGTTFHEWGLLCADGTLFSRKTSSPIVKNNTIRIVGEWRINIPS